LHGGTVKAHSEGEGRGSTFTVCFPLAAVHTVPARTGAAKEDHSLDGVRVLLAEDDPVSRELVVEMLQPRGATVTAAASAAEALSMIESFNPDVVISDIGMPAEDGYMLLSRIRALPPDRCGRVPVIALTALARPEDRRRALDAGFAAHLAKPIDANDLASAVSNLAGAHSAA
jgi:CheY-like chemotaxis protein